MTKIADMSIYDKNILKLFFPVEQFERNLLCSTGTAANHNLLKLLPWVDLDLFLARSNFANLAFI